MNGHRTNVLKALSQRTCGGANRLGGRAKPQRIGFLLVETVAVTVSVVLAIRALHWSSVSSVTWFLVPAILAAAALIPTAIRQSKLPRLGLKGEQAMRSLWAVCWASIVVLPSLTGVLWLLKWRGLKLPMGDVFIQDGQWVRWLLYQFMYVAVGEEVFFRGYVNGNILRAARAALQGRGRAQRWVSIVVSAGIFAVAHLTVQGRVTAALTFLPGLVLCWLFVHTESLLAPILFHGLANTYFCVMTALLY
ncbi:MAG: lysostaphin resistance A-like protein [Planctomycetota bacterium]